MSLSFSQIEPLKAPQVLVFEDVEVLDESIIRAKAIEETPPTPDYSSPKEKEAQPLELPEAKNEEDAVFPVPTPKAKRAVHLVKPPILSKKYDEKPKSLLKSIKIPDKKPDEEEKALLATNSTPLQSTNFSLSLSDAIRSKLARCWSIPIAAKNIHQLKVKLKVKLSESGEILSLNIMNARRHRNDPFFQAAIDSATRAIYKCAPFQLPPEKYHIWRTLEVEFDPKEML